MKNYAFIQLMILTGLLWTTTSKAASADLLQMLVGTYTTDSKSDGIYSLHFDQSSGKARIISSAKIGNPSFLRISKDARRIYSVSEYNSPTASANITAFNPETGTFGTTISAAASQTGKGAEDPCNIWSDDRFAVTANYTGGSLSVFAISGDKLDLRQHILFQKLRPSSTAHIHCALPTPDEKFLMVTDLGNDCIYRFTINPQADAGNDLPFLTDRRIVYNGPQGWGPRHFTFSKDGQFMYLINELGGTIVVLRYVNGNLLPIQSLMAEETPAHGSADIHLSPDGHYLYTSHRLKNDGIAIYKVNKATGLLTKKGYQQTARHPRNFAITPNGKYLLVASRDNNCIEIYRRNRHTGLLENTRQDIILPKPVCIQFVGL